MHLRLWIIVATLLLLGTLAYREWSLLPDGKTHVSFLDVGQGDSVLIRSHEGGNILVDGGPDWSALERLGEALPFFRRSLDLVIVTHGDPDHIGALPEILKRYDVGTLILPPRTEHSPLLKAALAAASEHHVPIRRIAAGEVVSIGSGATLTVLWPPATLPKGFSRTSNNQSLVLMLADGGKRMLLTGDIEETVEKTLVAARADLRAELLKIAHHGSRTSSGTGFLLAVHPSQAVISVGKDNTFGHPRPEILRRLEHFGIAVRRTDEEGTVEIAW